MVRSLGNMTSVLQINSACVLWERNLKISSGQQFRTAKLSGGH